MGPIAFGGIAGMFALAIVCGLGRFCFEYDRDKARTFVVAVTKRLVLGKTTRAIRVFFSGFNFDLFGKASGNCWFLLIVHGVPRLVKK
jgi:hypothetical protein